MSGKMNANAMKVVVIAAIGFVAVLALAAWLGRRSVGAQEREGVQISSSSVSSGSILSRPVETEPYPPPLSPTDTPVPSGEGALRDLSTGAVASRVVAEFVRYGWSSGEVKVLNAIDVNEADGAAFRASPGDIAQNGEPDVVVLLQGSFVINAPGLSKTARPLASAWVDRGTGKVYQVRTYTSVEKLPPGLR